MVRTLALTVAVVGPLLSTAAEAANYASSVVAYSPGMGFATDFATGGGLTNAAAALGEPSRSTPGPFGGPVDPFSPPYLGSQIVSMGAGGSLTLAMSDPISRDAGHPYGLDFTVFGNAGFVITNGDYTGGGITDGSLFGGSTGSSTVSVSADGVTFFQLQPPPGRGEVGTLFPTDGTGLFDLPVNPALSASDFSGQGLAGIRALYAGSAGGTSFDIDWARDSSGESVLLPEVRFIRIDARSGALEVDGVAGVSAVPESGTGVMLGLGMAASTLSLRRRKSARL